MVYLVHNVFLGGGYYNFVIYLSGSTLSIGKEEVNDTATIPGIIPGIDYTLSYTKLGTGVTVILNGVPSTWTDANDYSETVSLLGRYSIPTPLLFSGSISMCRIFNYALSPTQIANYSRPEHPIEAIHGGTGATKNVLDLNAEGINRDHHGIQTANTWGDCTNGVDATVVGCTLVLPPASNMGAMAFNGTTSFMEYIPSAAVTSSTSGSLSFWVWLSTLNNAQIFNVSKSSGLDLVWISVISSAWTVRVYKAGVLQYSAIITGVLPVANQWTHFVMVQNGVRPTYYINGILVNDTMTGNVNPGCWMSQLSGLNSIGIGAIHEENVISGYTGGLISKPCIHSVIITQESAQALYSCGN